MGGRWIILGTLLSCLVGCSFHARDAESYRQATRKLLETRSETVKGCYDAALKADPRAGGTVAVRFSVEAKTGRIAQVRLDGSGTTAPEALGTCVVQALDGLVLEPPDERTGDASFSWSFELRS